MSFRYNQLAADSLADHDYLKENITYDKAIISVDPQKEIIIENNINKTINNNMSNVTSKNTTIKKPVPSIEINEMSSQIITEFNNKLHQILLK